MYCNNCGIRLEEDALFCPNCGTKVEEVPQAGDEEDRTVLLEAEELVENVEDFGAEAAEPEQTEEAEQANEPEPAAEPEQTEVPEQSTEPQQIEEPAVEKVEAVEISPTGVVVTNEAALVRADNFEQKKFCPNCGAENGINDLFCQACGMFFGDADKAIRGNAQKKPKKNVLKILLPIAAAVAVIALCIVFVPRIFSSLGSKGNQKDFVLYIKDNELNFAKSSKFEPFLIDDKCYEDKDSSKYSYGYYVTCTPDNKYIYYPHNIDSGTNTYDLYRKKLGDKKAEAEKIDSNVFMYKLIDNDKVAYVKDRDDLRLYIYNKGESNKVASDVVTWDMYVSDDGKYVIWTTSDGNLYVQDTAMKKDKAKLDSDVDLLYAVSDNLNRIVYEKDDNLYILKDLEDKVKIASDIEDVYVYGINSNLQIYYMKEGDEVEMSAYDLVEDDYLAADENMVEPRIEDYQTVTYVNDFFGTREKIETSDSYYDALDEYQQKLTRDNVRSMLKNEEMDEIAIEIYHYDSRKNESNKVAETMVFDCGSLGTDTALMYLWTVDLENFEGPKLSGLIEDDYYAWEDTLESNMMECMQLQYIKNGELFEVSDIGIDKEDLVDVDDVFVYANEKTHTMYLGYEIYSSDYNIELYSFDYNASAADTQLVSDEVSSVEQICDEGIYYINEDDDLYCNETKIDSDVASSTVRCEDGMVLYLTDINKDYDEGTLKLYQSNKAVKIADDAAISRYQVFDGNKIVFMSDYNFNRYRGDLSVYNGKEVIKVDTDVQVFFICD